jgi:hypothetical protein
VHKDTIVPAQVSGETAGLAVCFPAPIINISDNKRYGRPQLPKSIMQTQQESSEEISDPL